MTWIYRDEYGAEQPISERRLRAALQRGRMGPRTPVRRAEGGAWMPLSDIGDQLPGGDPYDGATTVFELDPAQEPHSGADPAILRETERVARGNVSGSHRVLGTELLDLELEPTPITAHRLAPLEPSAPPRLQRLRALLIDVGLVALATTLTLGLAVWAGADATTRLAVASAGLVIWSVLWWALWEACTATTPGKRVMAIQVMGPDLLPTGPRRALVRNLVRFGLWLIPGVILVEAWRWWRQPEGRCWHDQFAGTLCVVRRGWVKADQRP